MKYYSEVLRKAFDSEKDCLEAERKHEEELQEAKRKNEELTAQRKARAKEVEDAYAAMVAAQTKFANLRRKFAEDFGAFHMTFSSSEGDLSDIFDEFFRIF